MSRRTAFLGALLVAAVVGVFGAVTIWPLVGNVITGAQAYGPPRIVPFTSPAPAKRDKPQPLGYSIHPVADIDPLLLRAQADGSTSVRTDVRWNLVEPTPGNYDWSSIDPTVAGAARAGQKVLLVVDTAPSWATGKRPPVRDWQTYPPLDPATYAHFVGVVLGHYGHGGTFWAAHPDIPRVYPAGVELWNEPNLSRYWPGRPDPAAYTRLIRAAYPAAKAVDPSVPVLAGSLARRGAYNDSSCSGVANGGSDKVGMNQLNFLQAMYADGARGYFDAISVHPYTARGDATADAMLAYHLCSPWSQINQTPVSIRSIMAAHGDADKQVWITEGGAPSCVPGATYTCASEAEQGRFAAEQVALWRSYPWAGGYYWYQLRDELEPGVDPRRAGELHFGVLHPDGSAKPAYADLREAFR